MQKRARDGIPAIVGRASVPGGFAARYFPNLVGRASVPGVIARQKLRRPQRGGLHPQSSSCSKKRSIDDENDDEDEYDYSPHSSHSMTKQLRALASWSQAHLPL